MKRGVLLSAVIAFPLSLPVAAQTMDHAHMPGMKMPAQSTPKPPRAAPTAKKRAPAKMPGKAAPKAVAPAVAPAQSGACPPEHAAMGHCMPSASASPISPESHQAHAESVTPSTGGTALPAGNAKAPVAPEPTYADRVWSRDAMAVARQQLYREHGGGSFSQVMLDLAEIQVRKGRGGYRWEGEGWFGGDIHRLVVKFEGEGAFGQGVEDAEIQALYSRAIGPYFNLQAGVRHDIQPTSRGYATIGVEGLAPYWFELDGALFLSDRGDVFARLEGYCDQRLTQRLIVQPRAEINVAAQDTPERDVGAGISDIELGLRLRHEIAREFAPYVGVSWDRKLGKTARLARAAGDEPSSLNIVAGIRAWF